MFRTPSLIALIFLLAGATASAQAGETTLTFALGIANHQGIPQTYGDNVTGPSTGGFTYSGSGIFTPNIAVSYAAVGGSCSGPGNGELRYGAFTYSDLPEVAHSGASCDSLEITLTASSGVLVQLHGFDLGYGNSQFGATVPEVSIIDAVTQSVLFSQTSVAVARIGLPHTSFDFTPPVTGMSLTIRISTIGLGNGADEVGIDNVRFGQIPGTTPPQANSLAASLQINTVGAIGVAGPFAVTVPSGGSLTLDWAGTPLRPLVLLAGPLNPTGFMPAPCVGAVHVGTPSLFFADVEILFDGTKPTFPNILFQLDGTGIAHQSFSVPPGSTGSITLQGVVINGPGAACPLVLTAASTVNW